MVIAGLGGILIPEKVEISRAQEAFDDSGELINEAPSKTLKALCRHLVEFAGRLAD